MTLCSLQVYWIHKSSRRYLSKDDKIEQDESLNLIENGWPKYEVAKFVDGDRITYQLVRKLSRRHRNGNAQFRNETDQFTKPSLFAPFVYLFHKDSIWSENTP